MSKLIRYTPEQAAVLDHLAEFDGLVLVQAGAGTGKSFMSRQIVQELPLKSGIYTAFNKAIVEEGIDRFHGTPIECKTVHALAYRYVKPSMTIQSFSYKCITEKITYTEKRKIIDVLDTFFVSDSTCMYEYFEAHFKTHPRKKYMTDLAIKYVDAMAEGTMSPTFNFLLKSLHLMMVEGTVEIKVDIAILDEINDVTAVALEIFRLIKAPKKLGLGETNQAIYGFLNLVNGFEILDKEATTLKFTQSYRCSEDIAERIENKMRAVLDKDFRFKGTDKPVANGKTLFCTLTNAAIVDKIQQRLASKRSFTLLRKPADIFAAPLAVLSASQGKRPYQQKFAFLVDVYEEFKAQDIHKTYFKFLLEEVKDDEIDNAVRLLQKLSANDVNLYSVYKEAKEAKPDKNYTISTVFTSKGLEFETVNISDDLNNKFLVACEGKLPEEDDITIKRCYYVACSRAGVYLNNALL
jgi:superfamily I DNA/RNA helicase